MPHKHRTVLLGAFTLAGVTMAITVVAAAGKSEVKPGEAMDMLREGNVRFVEGKAEHPHTDAERIREVATNGQHPFATVITCSDSRVPVELVFDRGIGDVFVIRVAGNVCDTDEIGSIEYGVDHLATPVLVVLGHTQCGAVTAVFKDAELHGSIPPLVDNIAPAVARAKQKHGDLPEDKLLKAAIEENVWQSIEDLIERSDATRKRLRARSLQVVGAIYELESGKVRWLGSHPQQMDLLKAADGEAETDEDDGHAAAPATLDHETVAAVATSTE